MSTGGPGIYPPSDKGDHCIIDDCPLWIPINGPSWLMSGAQKNPSSYISAPPPHHLRSLFAPGPSFSHLAPLASGSPFDFTLQCLIVTSTFYFEYVFTSALWYHITRAATQLQTLPPAHQVGPVPLRTVKSSSFLCKVSQPDPNQVRVGRCRERSGGSGGIAHLRVSLTSWYPMFKHIVNCVIYVNSMLIVIHLTLPLLKFQ